MSGKARKPNPYGWKAPGVRRTREEWEAHQRARRADVNRAAAAEVPAAIARARDDEAAHRLWAAGLLSPAMISMTLDSKGLHGPEVDIACGAAEPDVDLWEDGKLYPTWDQVLKLAKLVDCTPRFLMRGPGSIDEWDTTMRFHLSSAERRERPRDRFTARAIAARLGAL